MADVVAAHLLSKSVGWPHRPEDWQFMLKLGQGLVATVGDRVVGTALWWIYDGRIARLGMVIVDPGNQGAGIGKALIAAVLAAIDVPTIVLNATAAGEPLYRRLGFDAIGEIMQHQGVPCALPGVELPAGATLRTAKTGDLPALIALDAAAGGARREPVIAQLAARDDVVVLEQSGTIAGFAVCRRFGRGYVIGPVVAPDAAQARALFAHWIKVKPGAFLRADVPGGTDLPNWLEEFGLAAIAPAINMVRGPAPSPSMAVTIFGLVNQALG